MEFCILTLSHPSRRKTGTAENSYEYAITESFVRSYIIASRIQTTEASFACRWVSYSLTSEHHDGQYLHTNYRKAYGLCHCVNSHRRRRGNEATLHTPELYVHKRCNVSCTEYNILRPFLPTHPPTPFSRSWLYYLSVVSYSYRQQSRNSTLQVRK